MATHSAVCPACGERGIRATIHDEYHPEYPGGAWETGMIDEVEDCEECGHTPTDTEISAMQFDELDPYDD